ncbi:hypothetical protein MCHI_002707 [Candidatus Magnetoovum chiemensis]|nr:hypothetical protein MCHI_002707 [Candidatus Magnetoovum chiemensis]
MWKRLHEYKNTDESYQFLNRLRRYEVLLFGPVITVNGAGNKWIELRVDYELFLDADKIKNVLEHIRALLDEGQVSIEVDTLKFKTGQKLYDWVAEVKTEIKQDEIKQ